jgi:cell division protein FtsB
MISAVYTCIDRLNATLAEITQWAERKAEESLRPGSAVRMHPGRWMNIGLTSVGLLLLLYFSYHALAGNRGWFALQDQNQRHEALTLELETLRADRGLLERRVDLMDAERIDPDLLEESARSTLGFAHPDDLIIYRRP